VTGPGQARSALAGPDAPTRDAAPLPAAVLAVDVGNRKTDLVLVAADGTLISAVRGPTASHQAVGLERGLDRLVELAARAVAAAGDRPATLAAGDRPAPAAPIARVGAFCLAGADTPRDVRRLTRAIGRRGLVADVLVRNDTDAGLRAGAPDGWGVVLVCGEGFNCLGVHPDGQSVRFPALGTTSGDWGGGHGLGMAALGAALRGRDGRGPRTALERAVPAHFGLRRPLDVTYAIYEGRLAEGRLGELAPLVFAVARSGDAEARGIADRQADELAGAAVATIRRLRLVRAAVPVILSGGVFRTDDATFHARLRERIRAGVPRAQVARLGVPPVAGAALLGLDLLGAPASALERLRMELTEVRLSPTA
jgi:N-acetylglucosamine kinase-like BadF-type ATPase